MKLYHMRDFQWKLTYETKIELCKSIQSSYSVFHGFPNDAHVIFDAYVGDEFMVRFLLTCKKTDDYFNFARSIYHHVKGLLVPVNDKGKGIEVHLSWDTFDRVNIIRRPLYGTIRQRYYYLPAKSKKVKYLLTDFLFDSFWNFFYESDSGFHYWSSSLPKIHSELVRMAKSIYQLHNIDDPLSRLEAINALIAFYKMHPHYALMQTSTDIVEYAKLIYNSAYSNAVLSLMNFFVKKELLEALNIVLISYKDATSNIEKIIEKVKEDDNHVP